ncbi:hypothetical protein DFA_01292 [Cavenderia fasciculata]|uniref:Trm112p-like protein n=1 Tax=Cavenderia fasciculata TaxID=261658 RepID=F4PRX2_CACFS|nr:uncharacterized protein DFA_01292 [Cavenderia fasciculata]EGG21408.1 hypothetical protein DFA_01292 [Cavenderia fasciculata]|eukprot:XP_004359258.1 hypothetical protein DFA_01292 [Cavenderia fasciculata]
MACTKKQCVGRGFPLKLEANEIAQLSQPFNYEFVKNIFPKLDWNGIQLVAKQLNVVLPEQGSVEDEEFVKTLFNLLCNLKVINGSLTCPSCNRVYPIEVGIPNMLLKEEEIYQDIQRMADKEKEAQEEESDEEEDSDEEMEE